MTPVFLSDSFWLHFGTSSATTGAATDADSTPTVVVAEDGTDMGYSPTVTNVATGLYKVQIDATAGNGFEAGKRYSCYAVATVGTITGRDGIGEFEVLAVDLNTGVASVTGTVTMSAAERNSIADALLGRNVAGGSSTGRIVSEALYVLRNKTLISAGTLTVYQTDDTTSAFTATVTTAAGNPITAIDPA